MTEKKYDVAILGGGPGGYPAAIKLAQNGKKVALIEALALGGTCLNRGCIPSKALISNAEALHTIKNAKEFCIDSKGADFNFGAMIEQKNGIVNKLKTSLEGLIQANKIDVFQGFGKFMSRNELKVMGKDNTFLKADNIIIATGSEPKEIKAFPFDGKLIHSSTTILDLEKLPKKMIIVGGGVIGCEFASLFCELGVEVVIIEALPRILPLECETVSEQLSKSFQKRKITLCVNSPVAEILTRPHSVQVILKDGKTIDADLALVAIGRAFNSDKIDIEKAGVVTDRGIIVIDENMQTNVPGVYAVGDVTGKALYAHAATHQGLVAASHILGEKLHMNYDAIPGVIFTRPEIGTCGMNFDAALKRGYAAKRVTYPFSALGKAQAAKQTEGFCQIIFDENTRQILGAQIVGHEASNLIAEIAMAIANELTVECVAETIHAHPTLQEAWMEAALIAGGSPLHFPPLKKS